MKSKVIFQMVSLLSLSLSLRAQTADEIVAKAIAARGGMDKIKAVQSLRMTGPISLSADQQATLIVDMKRPGKFRQELVLNGKSMLRVTNGSAGWTFNPFSDNAQPQPLSAEEMKNAAEQADFDKPLLDYKAKGNQVELLGKEKVDGKDAYKLKVTMKDGPIRDDFIDAESFLEIKWQGKVMVQGEQREFETSFHDYRRVEGLMFPFLLESATPGGPVTQTITFEKIEINPQLDDALFEKPAMPAPPKTP